MTMTTHPPVEDLRRDVAACTRLLVHVGIIDFSGHVSARIADDRIVILPRDMSRAAVTAESLLVVDLDDQLIEGSEPPPAEVAMHTGVYRARPDVMAVCHGHPPTSTSLTMTDQPLLPMRHFAYRHPEGVPVHPDVTHIYTREQGDEVAATLSDGDACLIRGHGTVVTGRNIQELFMRCLDLEENARTLLNAQQAGGTILPLTLEECARISDSYGKTSHRPGKIWNHYLQIGRRAGIL
jgi:ribulose-5-phosphate 4-epimerase/fuculose-1-phosphate aldolase